MMRAAVLGCGAVFAVVALGCDSARPAPRPPANEAPPAAAPPVPEAIRFQKGQLHAHSNRSLDSDTPPEEAAAWYAAHGYDFVVFTDHNRITEIPGPPGMLVIPGVELTQNLRTCDPPPLNPSFACLLHVNALFVVTPPGLEGTLLDWGPRTSLRRVDLYGRAVDRASSLGGIAQLNHPNFQRGGSLEVLLSLARRGLVLVEIANQAVDSENEGDRETPSTEALWDSALGEGARVFGTASDDAHHYNDAARVRATGEIAYVGARGFVMVRAQKSAASIRAAIARGDFYSSTGVILDRLEMSADAIDIDVHPGEGTPHIEVIANGRVVEQVSGAALRFDAKKVSAGYVRVRVTEGGGRRAWTQPVWVPYRR